MFSNLFGKKTPEPPPPPPPPRVPPLTEPRPISLPLPWQKRIERLPPLKKPDIPPYPPSLIIGLGRVGEIVLHQIKANLVERYQGGFPDEVRLLLIESPNTLGDSMLDDRKERVSYHRENDPSPETCADLAKTGAQPYVWLREFEHQPSARALARARLIVNINNRAAPIPRALREALIHFRTTAPQVYFVGDLTHPDCAPLWDVSYLLRHKIAEGMGIGREMHTARFIAVLAAQPSAISPGEAGNVFATFRELERFTSNGKSVFAYPAQEFSGVADSALIDLCFLVDTSAHRTGWNLSAEPETEGVARVMSEALSVLLEPDGGKVRDDLTQAISSSTDQTNQQTWISGLSAATVILPIGELRRAAERRLLRTLFFGGEVNRPAEGLIPVPLGKDKPAAEEVSESEARQAALEFLREETPNHYPSFAILADALENKKWDAPESYWNEKTDALFAAKLAAWATIELNGREEESFTARSNRLLPSLSKVKTLTNLLEQAPLSLSRNATVKGALNKSLRARLEKWAEAVTQLESELSSWVAALIGGSTAGPDPSLLQVVEGEWFNMRASLYQQISAPARRVLIEIVGKEDESPYPGLEYPFYKDYLRPELEKSQSGDTLISKLAARVRWLCRAEPNGMRLQLFVADAEYGDDGGGALPRMFFGSQQWLEAYRKLCGLAEYYSAHLEERKDIDLTQVSDFFAEQPAFLPFSSSRAQTTLADKSEDKHYLLTPKLEWQNDLRQPQNIKPDFIQRGTSGNPARAITWLSVRHKIFLTGADVYKQAETSYSFEPESHIFFAEQRAAYAENRLNRSNHSVEARQYLHPSFIRLFELGEKISEKHVTLADLFLRGWLCQLIVSDERMQTWRVPLIGKFEAIEFESKQRTLLDALEKFALEIPCSPSLHAVADPLAVRNRPLYVAALAEAIKKKIETNRDGWLIQVGLIPQIEQEADFRAKSLASYLRFLAKEEQRGNY